MKHLFIYLGISLMLFASCVQKDLVEVAYINEAEGSTFTPAEVSALGDEIAINFSTNYKWQIKGYTKLDFCSLSALKGESGDVSLIVKVEPNATDAVRKAEFSILAGAAVKTVTITQTEANALDINTVTFPVLAAGGLVEVPVSSNIEYIVNIPSDITWIKRLPDTKTMVNSTIMLQVDPNEKWLSRSATGITVTGKDIEGEDIVHTLTVNQEPGNVNTIWEKDFGGDFSVVGRTDALRLAMYGKHILMADGAKIHKINPVTGAYEGEMTIPGLTVAPQSMTNDDAGNLIFAADAKCASEDFVVYAYDGTSVNELARYKAKNLYAGVLQNVRVIGDIKKKAVVSACASSLNYFVAWQIENGVASKPVAKQFAGTTVWNPRNCVVSPVSDELKGGLVSIGYAGTPYCLYYNSDPATAKNDNWMNVFDTKTAGNENYCAVSIAEYKGRKYCAIAQDGHFSWSVAPKVYLLDITDMNAVTLEYEGKFTGTFGKVGVNDVKLVVMEDKLYIGLVNAGWNYAGCIELTKK